MPLHIFLDTGPLGAITNPRKPPLTVEMLRWAAGHLRAGHLLLTPSIADYEVRRELLRLGKSNGLLSLDAWNSVTPDRYVTLTDEALKRAANLWARVRNQGVVTADPKELDCDALIAAQALEYGALRGLAPDEMVVATTNVGHLLQFVRAETWDKI